MDAYICQIKENKMPNCLFQYPIEGERMLANKEAVRHYSEQISSAIKLYECKLKSGIAAYKCLKSDMNKLIKQPSRTMEEDTGSSLVEDIRQFNKLGLNTWQPVIDERGHFLGMGVLDQTKNHFLQYNTIGDWLKKKPYRKISVCYGTVLCPCKRVHRNIQNISFIEKKDVPFSSLGCDNI